VVVDTLKGEKPTSYSSEKGKSCSYSPDGNQIANASDKAIQLWDVPNRRQVGTLKGYFRACAYSPDGRRLVSASSDKTLKVWDTATLAEIVTLSGHSKEVAACAFSPDGRRVVSASLDRTLRVWDAETGAEIFVLQGHTDAIKSCAYSADGRRIASSSYDTWKIWDAVAGTELVTFRARLRSTAVCDCVVDRESVFYASDEDGAFQLIEANSGFELSCFPSAGWFSVLAFDRSLRHMAAGDLNGTVYVLERMARERSRDTFQTTIIRLYCFDPQTWSSQLTARCEQCGYLFAPEDSTVEVVREVAAQVGGAVGQAAIAALPESAWSDPRLVSECASCGVRLIFNPFIVDNRDRY
jgi:WD40 repeat protein